MAKRMVIMLLAVAGFIGIVGFVKYRGIKASMGQGGYQPPPEAVTTVIARQEQWQGALGAIGTAAAVNGGMVSADLPGVGLKIGFGSGEGVDAGPDAVPLRHPPEAGV